MFGYSADEVLGRRLDVLIPERLRPSHWAAFDVAIETGKMKHGRESMTTRSMHKDGRDHVWITEVRLDLDGRGAVEFVDGSQVVRGQAEKVDAR